MNPPDPVQNLSGRTLEVERRALAQTRAVAQVSQNLRQFQPGGATIHHGHAGTRHLIVTVKRQDGAVVAAADDNHLCPILDALPRHPLEVGNQPPMRLGDTFQEQRHIRGRIERAYRAGDGPAYHAVCVRNKAHLLPFEDGNAALKVNTVEDAEILVREFAAQWVNRDAFFLGAWQKTDPTVFVAQIYVGPVNWDLPEFALGYFVDCLHEGQGFVTEAARVALGFVFNNLGAYRVRLGCNDTNERSYRVAERCGFTREAHLRQTQSKVCLPDGTFTGEYIYGLLRSEFEAASTH